MFSLVRSGGRLPLNLGSLSMAMWVVLGSLAFAGDGGGGHNGDGDMSYGTLGWEPYGLYPGYYGFSHRYHLGYGYGLGALGVGADGGYPFYAGPGYPHEPPCLNRFGPATPSVYFGGPDYPRFGYSNFFQEVGGLVIERPVVSVGEPGEFGYVDARGDVAPTHDFGSFTGALPYPETKFAPYASEAAATGSSSPDTGRRSTAPVESRPGASPSLPSTSLSPAVGPVTNLGGSGRDLGIDQEPATESNGTRGIKVIRVYPGSPADQAGLRVGDVIHSINGYLTTERGNLAWIIAVATPDNVVKIYTRTASDGQMHAMLAKLPSPPPVNTERPSFLPRVGNGPPPATR
jgi:hypothetical protein